MILRVEESIPNAVVLVADASGGEIPESMNRSPVAATPAAIAVGTRSEVDGPTAIVLSDEDHAPRSGQFLVHAGLLELPSRCVVVFTVLDRRLLEIYVARERVHVEIWSNHDTEPDEIVIVVAAPW